MTGICNQGPNAGSGGGGGGANTFAGPMEILNLMQVVEVVDMVCWDGPGGTNLGSGQLNPTLVFQICGGQCPANPTLDWWWWWRNWWLLSSVPVPVEWGTAGTGGGGGGGGPRTPLHPNAPQPGWW